jgi:hypothetical protein
MFRVLFSTAICLALLTSTAQAGRVAPNNFAPLPPEVKKEIEARTFGWKLMLAGLAGVLVLGAIGQFVLSIRNFRRAAAEERASVDDLDEDQPHLDDAFPEADPEVDPDADWESAMGGPIPIKPPTPEPEPVDLHGIIANKR